MKDKVEEKGFFAVRLQDLIETLGLKQGDFAERIGTDQATVSRWLSGEREPSWTQLQQIIFTFHINPVRLFEWE